MTTRNFDVLIVGGGVIGLTTGLEILKLNRKLSVLIIEKEAQYGMHASGRNSGVLHAGFYYPPDSRKAQFSTAGNTQLSDFCDQNRIKVNRCGKVLVAQDDSEAETIDYLYNQGRASGVELEVIDSEFLGDFEPLAKTWKKFLWSPNTSVVDPLKVLAAIASRYNELGGVLTFGQPIELLGPNILQLGDERITYRHLVNSAGSQADRIAQFFGVAKEYSMVPFVGVYKSIPHSLLPIKTLVYPVPNLDYPFLGVHFTLTANGEVTIGPTAIPLFGREQYSLGEIPASRDLMSSMRGYFSLASHRKVNLSRIAKVELAMLSKKLMVREATKLIPSTPPASYWNKSKIGIRSQLIDLRAGELVKDYLVLHSANETHVLNLVSPGFTSAFPLAKEIANGVVGKI